MVARVVIHDRFYVPLRHVDVAALKREYEVPIQTKRDCRPECPLSQKRGRYCSTCPSKDAKLKLWEVIRTEGGKKVIAVPSGDSAKLRSVLNTKRVKFVDRRPSPEFRSALRWRGKLRKKGDVDDDGNPYADQRGMVRAWRDHVDGGETGGTIVSPPRCVTGDTLIATTRGLTRISDWAEGLKPGTYEEFALRGRRKRLLVTTEYGSAVEPSQLWVSAPERIHRVTLRGGLTVSGTADHPIKTLEGWTKLRDVKRGQVVPVYYGQNVWSCTDAVSEELARFLGFWVSEGSGSKSYVHVTNYDDSIRELCRRVFLSISPNAAIVERTRAGYTEESGVRRCIGTRDPAVYRYLDTLADGLWRKSADKVIPRAVLESSSSVVCAFLQALFEGDGSVGRVGVGYASLSKVLIDQLRVVLANLGIVTSTRRRMSWATNGSPSQVSKPYWIISVKGPSLRVFYERIGFFSPRKKRKLKRVLRAYEAKGVHQPMWYEAYPDTICREWHDLVDAINVAWASFRVQRADNGSFGRHPVSFGAEVVQRARCEGRRTGRSSSRLTRDRLARYCEYLEKSPRWRDLPRGLREKVLGFRDHYLDPKCYWTVVRSVRQLRKKRPTYDFHVPLHHKFMGNGILNHNTGKCVYGDTLIRTYDGLVPVSSLFRSSVDIERVGRFGFVSTPWGVREVRGLYSKVVDKTVEILLQSGIRLGGTENHPVYVFGEDARWSWKTLGAVEVDDQVLLPLSLPLELLGPQLYEDEAIVLAAAAVRGLWPKRVAGVFDVDPEEFSDPQRIKLAFARRYHVVPNDRGRLVATVQTDGLPGASWVPKSVYRTGPAATRAMLKTLFDGALDRGGYRVIELPKSFAEVVHLAFVGYGVYATIEYHEGYGHVAVARAENLDEAFARAATLAVRAEMKGAPSTPHGLVDRVLVAKSVASPRRVYDLMVPSVKSFVANGVAAHNTVIGVRSALMHRQRAFITGSQIDFLRQFGMRFGENSNARELYKQGKRPVVLVDPKGWREGPKYGVHVVKKWGPEARRADVVMSSYQQFVHPERGHERLKRYVSGKFGTMVIDEQHQANAAAFSRVANRAAVRRRLGLTATLHRKDGLEKVCAAVVGPMVAKGRAVSTLPKLELKETGVHAPRSHKTWNGIVSFLSRSEERNKVIVRQIFKDLRSDPKACVVVPVVRVAHVHELVKLVNQQALFCRQNRGESWARELAVAYYGKTNTGEVLAQVRAGRARVVIANVRMVQHGLDVARWTHVYVNVIPTSNAMLTWQLINRVCTPYDAKLRAKIGAKPRPVARIFIDPMSASVFCFAKVFNEKLYGYAAGLRGDNFIEAKTYAVDRRQLDRMVQIAKYPKLYDPKEAGVKVILGKTRLGKKRTKETWTPAPRGIRRF